MSVESDGTGVVAHVGLHAMGAFSDRLGLSHSLSSRIPARGERLPVHDRGTVLTHMALMIAGGGESCADIEHLRLQSDPFGSIASDSTVYRTFHELDESTLIELATATAETRATVWSRLGLTTSKDPVVLDIDATLIDVHSENKENAAPTYKKGYGFHPMLCFADATGECLAGTLRTGAQRSLIPALDFRYWGFWTDQDGDPRELDATMRAHAHVENHIQRLKDSGLRSMPFTKFAANAAWLFAVRLSNDLVRWFQLLCCTGAWRSARPKALRWGFWHAPARLVRRGRQVVVRVIAGWPATAAIESA